VNYGNPNIQDAQGIGFEFNNHTLEPMNYDLGILTISNQDKTIYTTIDLQK
jgi:hypothetical protein